MEFTKELIEKAKECKSAEEILVFAKNNEMEITKEDAEILLGEFREGELSDEELGNVAGGAEGCKPANRHEFISWNNEEDVQFIFNEGDIVEALAFGCEHHTATCKVVSRKADLVKINEYISKYADVYWLEKQPGVKAAFVKKWYTRDRIEK